LSTLIAPTNGFALPAGSTIPSTIPGALQYISPGLQPPPGFVPPFLLPLGAGLNCTLKDLRPEIAGYIAAGDSLRLSVLTGLTSQVVRFRGRMLVEPCQWSYFGRDVTGTSAGGIDRVVLPMAEGVLVNIAASVDSDVVGPGDVYVLVELGRTDTGVFRPHHVVIEGYVTTNAPLVGGATAPSPGNASAGSGVGRFIVGVLTGTEFADGITFTPPAGTAERVVYLAGTFSTSAVAGTRVVRLNLHDANGFAWNLETGISQGPSTAQAYQWQTETREQTDSQNERVEQIPAQLWFPSAYIVQAQRSNPGAGDAWGFVDITRERRSML
jgi:hypothetical protein